MFGDSVSEKTFNEALQALVFATVTSHLLLANKQQTDDFITIMSRASIEAGKVQKDVLRFIAKRAGELRHAHADHQATIATDSALNDALRNSDS